MRHIRMREAVEFRRIAALLTAAGAPDATEVVVPPGDDAAALRLAGEELLLVTSDLSIEGIHFRRDWLTWEVIGYRAAAAALSDLAAMAGRAIGVLVSVALAPELDARVGEELAAGLGTCLRSTGAALLGGDLSASPGPLVLDVVAVGAARSPVSRSGALPGDELWLTGELGAAAAAASAWSSGLEPDPRAREAFERPSPRLREARWLTENLDVHAMIDLSDGVAGDAEHVAAASGVRLEFGEQSIPIHPVLEAYERVDVARRIAFGGGEDYELLVAAGARGREDIAGAFEREFGVRLTRVGRVTEGEGVSWLAADGTERPPGWEGFDHFARRGPGA